MRAALDGSAAESGRLAWQEEGQRFEGVAGNSRRVRWQAGAFV
jgi:hypothetical protein